MLMSFDALIMGLCDVRLACQSNGALGLPDLVDGEAGVVAEVLGLDVADDEGEEVAVLLHAVLRVRPQLLAAKVPFNLQIIVLNFRVFSLLSSIFVLTLGCGLADTWHVRLALLPPEALTTAGWSLEDAIAAWPGFAPRNAVEHRQYREPRTAPRVTESR